MLEVTMPGSRSDARPAGRRGWVRKNMAMDPKKLAAVKGFLGVRTETEAVDAALDLVAFQAEVSRGLDAAAALGPIRDVFRR
jgi:hypothetical protein